MVSSVFAAGAAMAAGSGAGDSGLTSAAGASFLMPAAGSMPGFSSAGGGHAAVSMRCGGRRVYGAGGGAAGDSGLTAAGASVLMSAARPSAPCFSPTDGGHAAVSMQCGGRRVYGVGSGAAGDSLTAAGACVSALAAARLRDGCDGGGAAARRFVGGAGMPREVMPPAIPAPPADCSAACRIRVILSSSPLTACTSSVPGRGKLTTRRPALRTASSYARAASLAVQKWPPREVVAPPTVQFALNTAAVRALQ